jgi:hypothetical protein
MTLLNNQPSLVNYKQVPSVMLLTMQNFRHPLPNVTVVPFIVNIDSLHDTILFRGPESKIVG